MRHMIVGVTHALGMVIPVSLGHHWPPDKQCYCSSYTCFSVVTDRQGDWGSLFPQGVQSNSCQKYHNSDFYNFWTKMHKILIGRLLNPNLSVLKMLQPLNFLHITLIHVQSALFFPQGCQSSPKGVQSNSCQKYHNSDFYNFWTKMQKKLIGRLLNPNLSVLKMLQPLNFLHITLIHVQSALFPPPLHSAHKWVQYNSSQNIIIQVSITSGPKCSKF